MEATERTRLRALYDGITMPWTAQPHIVDGDKHSCSALVLCPYSDDGDTTTVAKIGMGYGEECDNVHAALIVGAVNALPALLDALDAAERDTAREDLARIGRLVGCDSLVGVEIHAAVEHELLERDAARDAAERAERERDDARAEVETLRAEVALLREIIAWPTVTP
jgi:hypothetical protein